MQQILSMPFTDHPCLGTSVYGAQKECNVSVHCLLFVVIAPRYYPHWL